MSLWEKIQEGWGLERVPADLSKELCCSICHATKYLYTAHSTKIPVDPASGYERWRKSRQDLIESLRSYTFCKTHAIWYYQEDIS